MNERPRPEIIKEQFDVVIEVIGFIGLLFLLLLPFLFYSQLPEEIPIHFNAAGKVDGYGTRKFIWVLPTIGLFIFLLIYWINKFPHRFNFPRKVTQENASELYKATQRMLRIMNTLIICSFLFITINIYQSAQNGDGQLGVWFLPVFLFLLFGNIGWGLSKVMKA